VFIIEVIGWIIMLNAVFFTAKLFLSKPFSLLTAIAFPLFLLNYTEQGGSAEEFIIIFQSASFCFFLHYLKDENGVPHSSRIMFIHGIMSSMAFFIKLNLAIFWLFPLLFIFINILFHKQYINFIKNVLGYAAGFLLIAAPIILYFAVNSSLDKAYEIYIVLNSNYASIPESAGEKFILLLTRIYELFRNNPLAFTLMTLGVFYFPFIYLKSMPRKLTYMLCGISVFIVISITRSFFNYYNIPLCIFLIAGLISLMAHLESYITIRNVKYTVAILSIIAVLYSINIKKFFNTGGDAILNHSTTGVISQFGKIINEENNPVVVNLGFGQANAVFTYCNIIPALTYSMTPNIPHDLYPELRDEQTNYIQSKEPQFVILTNGSMNYEYFMGLPALTENYELISTYIDVNEYLISKGKFYSYYLFRKKQ